MKRETFNVFVGLVLMLAIAFAFTYVVAINVEYVRTTGFETVVVKEKYIKRYGEIDKFMVVTDKGIYTNEDSLYNFKYYSADLQARFEVGKTYRIEYMGIRNNVHSMFPNIISAEEIPTVNKK